MAAYNDDDFGDDEDFGLGDGIGGGVYDPPQPTGHAIHLSANAAPAVSNQPILQQVQSNGGAREMQTPQAAGHSLAKEEDVDELDLYGDVAEHGAFGTPGENQQQQTAPVQQQQQQQSGETTRGAQPADTGPPPPPPQQQQQQQHSGALVPAIPQPGSKVYIGNLQWWTTDAQLENRCREFGEITGVKIFADEASGKSKGAAQIDFVEAGAAAACKIALHGKEIDGKTCVVTLPSTGVTLKPQPPGGAGARGPMPGRGLPPGAPFMGTGRGPVYPGRGRGGFGPNAMIGGHMGHNPMMGAPNGMMGGRSGPGGGMQGMGFMGTGGGMGMGMGSHMMGGRGMGMAGMPTPFTMQGGMGFRPMQQQQPQPPQQQQASTTGSGGARGDGEAGAKRQRSE